MKYETLTGVVLNKSINNNFESTYTHFERRMGNVFLFKLRVLPAQIKLKFFWSFQFFGSPLSVRGPKVWFLSISLSVCPSEYSQKQLIRLFFFVFLRGVRAQWSSKTDGYRYFRKFYIRQYLGKIGQSGPKRALIIFFLAKKLHWFFWK